jgi:hypothetical protein
VASEVVDDVRRFRSVIEDGACQIDQKIMWCRSVVSLLLVCALAFY